MNTISINYTLKYQFKTHPNIKVDSKGNIFNSKTGRKKKMCYNGGSIGVWLDAKTFVIKSKLNSQIELIPKIDCPF